LHFGQISAQRVALNVLSSKKNSESFVEELIVRRELSDNFCYYNRHYDSFEGFPNWAKKSLDDYRVDEREYLYSRAELEKGKTHDDLWNSAQIEMVKLGKMHGYMRMYWARNFLNGLSPPSPRMRLLSSLTANMNWMVGTPMDMWELPGALEVFTIELGESAWSLARSDT
jgi:deoxyribodipyrimidine photo-lyase